MTWNAWREHFEQNAQRPVPMVEAPELTEDHRVALATSLSRFQLGESGEGRIAHDIDTARLPGIDADYRAALKRFVAEEGRHARVLGLMVNALGGRLLGRQWSERAFVGVRRAFGIRFKLLVLMAAEVIGIAFYGALSTVLPDGSMRRALLQICDDEERHLEFHVDFFRSQRVRPVSAAVLWLAWWPVAMAAGLVVLVDHRRTLGVLGLSSAQVVKLMWRRVRQGASFAGALPRSRPALT